METLKPKRIMPREYLKKINQYYLYKIIEKVDYDILLKRKDQFNCGTNYC